MTQRTVHEAQLKQSTHEHHRTASHRPQRTVHFSTSPTFPTTYPIATNIN